MYYHVMSCMYHVYIMCIYIYIYITYILHIIKWMFQSSLQELLREVSWSHRVDWWCRNMQDSRCWFFSIDIFVTQHILATDLNTSQLKHVCSKMCCWLLWGFHPFLPSLFARLLASSFGIGVCCPVFSKTHPILSILWVRCPLSKITVGLWNLWMCLRQLDRC